KVFPREPLSGGRLDKALMAIWLGCAMPACNGAPSGSRSAFPSRRSAPALPAGSAWGCGGGCLGDPSYQGDKLKAAGQEMGITIATKVCGAKGGLSRPKSATKA
ncbi:MAG TPA: hypothetical protein VEB64_17615, partial [Azospirillaceae bacterium]|nr:hypothetical protein [Azospirillaceae bacterium]